MIVEHQPTKQPRVNSTAPGYMAFLSFDYVRAWWRLFQKGYWLTQLLFY